MEIMRQQENFKQLLINKLSHLKNDFKDEPPEDVKHSNSKDKKYKVRKGGWFQPLAHSLSKIISRQLNGELIVSDELFNEIFSYWRSITTPPFTTQELIEQTNLDEADTIINKILAELKK